MCVKGIANSAHLNISSASLMPTIFVRGILK